MEEPFTGCGAVLAGGKSSRMGRDKALLDAGGMTMIERSLEALRPLVSTLLIVSETGDRYQAAGCREVADRTPGLGPVGGIVTALHEFGPGLHLMVACDMPFLRTELLDLLLQSADAECDAVVPMVNDRPEPLCAAYRHTALPILEQFLEEGHRAAHRALGLVRTIYIGEEELRRVDPDLASMINVNTTADADRRLRNRHSSLDASGRCADPA